MKTFVQEGKVITITAAADVVSGQPVLTNELFGVASGAALTGAEFELYTQGVIAIAKKDTIVTAVGEEAFFDNATGEMTNVSAAGLFKVGVFTEVSGASDATVDVRLDGIAVTAV